jgi:hypothetical protein
VSDQEFFFDIEVAGNQANDQMVAEVTRTVLGQVGYAPSAIDAMSGELHKALAARADGARQRCRVHFRSAGGRMEIAVDGAGIAEWRTAWPLPAS